MTPSAVNTSDFDEVHREILADSPEATALWNATEAKRKIALMLMSTRSSAGLTQAGLADKAGWHKSFVSRLEAAGGPVPDLITIARYVEACGAKAGLIVGTVEDPDRVRVQRAIDLQAGGLFDRVEPEETLRLTG